MQNYPEADVTRLNLDQDLLKELGRRISLIYLGKSHSSSALHEEVIACLEKEGGKHQALTELLNQVEKGKAALLKGDLYAYGEAMTQNNECQRSLHAGLICEEADAVIDIAKGHGAAGWKVNGAGGKGGSLTLLGSEDEEQRHRMLEEIKALGRGIEPLPIVLSPTGLEVK